MSWSYQAVGKPAAVAKACRAQKDVYPCAEPEESMRQVALELMAVSAEAQGENIMVTATGGGSMWKEGDVVRQNNIQIKVDPLFGYVE